MGGARYQRYTSYLAKTTLVGSLAFLPGLAATSRAQNEVLVDRLVAEVNGEPLTFSEVMEKVKNGPLVEVSAFPAQESDPPFNLALQDLVNFKLIMQKAEEFGIEVTEENLDQEIDKFLVKRNLTMSGLHEALQQQGMTYEEYRDDFKNQMILTQFQGRVILPSIKITEKDIEIYYLRMTGNSSDTLKLTLRQIFIGVDEAAPDSIRKGKETLATTVYQKLQDGMPFEEAVKVYSDNEGGRASGGLMPDIFLKDLAQPFQVAIEPLREGEFSPPVKTQSGYYIFYLQGKAFSGSQEFARKKKELEARLTQEEVEKQTMKWLSDQRKKSKIKIIDDSSSKS